MKKITPRNAALALVALVAVLVVLANRFAGGDTSGVTAIPPQASASASTTTSAAAAPAGVSPSTAGGATAAGSAAPAATGGDDGDDGAAEPPIIASPAEQPDVREAATAFTAAWLNTTGRSPEVWRAALADRITGDLAEDLSYADPDSVPDGKVGTPVKVTAEGSLFNADAPVVEVAPGGKTVGTLHLTLVRDGRTWLVSEIDWQVSR